MKWHCTNARPGHHKLESESIDLLEKDCVVTMLEHRFLTGNELVLPIGIGIEIVLVLCAVEIGGLCLEVFALWREGLGAMQVLQ